MVLRPSRPSHTRRKHAKSDVLPCAPPRIEMRDLNPSGGKLGERPDSGSANSHFHETNEVVEAVKTDGSEDVRNNDGLMVADLVCTNVHVRKSIQHTNLATYGGEEDHETSDVRIKEQSVRSLAYEGRRRDCHDIQTSQCHETPSDRRLTRVGNEITFSSPFVD
jgi:hypothetical protein